MIEVTDKWNKSYSDSMKNCKNYSSYSYIILLSDSLGSKNKYILFNNFNNKYYSYKKN